MTDPYRGSGRHSGDDYSGSDHSYGAAYSNGPARGRRRRAADDDPDLDGFLSELGGGSRGRATAGRASVGRSAFGGYDDHDAGHTTSGRASVGRASVGRASVGRASVGAAGASGRAQVRPGAPYGPDGPAGPGGPGRRSRLDRHRKGGEAALAKKRRRRQKIVAILAISVMLLGLMVLGGTYYFVNVPTPNELAGMSQNSTLLYSNGKTMAKVGDENRKIVDITDIPKHVQRAVVTAEDRSFYENSGIDVKGILRAAWNNVTDDDTEGASTITQQYARNAANLDRGVSYTRKVREMAMAVKLNQQYSKDKILEMYLNTIYFGRNANGIAAASEAYFGKPVQELTVAEGALIASVIKNPHGYDPANSDQDRAEARMRWVLKNMVQMNWLSAKEAKEAKFPKVQDASKATGAQFGLDKPTGNVVKFVEKELDAMGITRQELRTNGYTVHTTIDPKMQRAAEHAARTVLKGQDKKLATALVAVEPGTGEVKAYYGGENGMAGYDFAASRHQPGSSFKAYVLAAALKKGISVKSYWDGSSPQDFPERGKPLRNSDNDNSCKRCTLEMATVKSLNTTYYAVTDEVGKGKVVELASKAGVRTMAKDNESGKYVPVDLTKEPIEAAKKFPNELGIGQYPISVVDNAAGFATFANNGEHVTTHFVEKVTQNGDLVGKPDVTTTEAFTPEVAADATAVLRKVVAGGGDNLENGRPAAGKTGTWQFGETGDNAHAWMAGYTPQVAAAVWMGRAGEEGPIRTKENTKIYGSGLPADIWKIFMNRALQGKPNKQFPEPQYLGDEGAGNMKSPEPPPSPTSTGQPSGPPTNPTDPDEPTGPAPTGSPPCQPQPFCRDDDTNQSETPT